MVWSNSAPECIVVEVEVAQYGYRGLNRRVRCFLVQTRYAASHPSDNSHNGGSCNLGFNFLPGVVVLGGIVHVINENGGVLGNLPPILRAGNPRFTLLAAWVCVGIKGKGHDGCGAASRRE